MSQLQVRMRPDLILEQSAPGEAWVVQDPLSLRYFHLRDEECALLRMLDGRLTLEELRQRFEVMFAPLQLTAAQLQAFLHRLHELGLLIVDAHGQGAVVARRYAAFRRKTLLLSLANPLAIRLPGVPAAAWVDWLYRRCRFLLTPTVLALCSLFVLGAAALIVVQWPEFWNRLPAAEAFFALDQGIWFLVALIAVKCLHELGHALALTHFGGKVHAVGVTLLLFSPALYCDVSDAWRLHPTWKRVVVSAAGMLVELVLAAAAVFLWRFSEPGLVHALSLRVLFICTVSTLLFNANPLIRGDGYYILSDLVKIPNLGQESRSALSQLAGELLLGWPKSDDQLSSPWRTIPLALYGALSLLYGWFLIGAILWFFTAMLRPHGLSSVAIALAAVVIGGATLPPLVSAGRMFLRRSRRPRVQRGRVTLSALVMLAIGLAIGLLPLPFHVSAPMWLEPAQPHNVYVTVPGIMSHQIAPGTRVKRGESLAVLKNPQLEDQLTDLAAEAARHQLRLAQLRLLIGNDPSVGPLIPAEEKTLEDVRQRLKQAAEEAERLTLRAQRDGAVIEPASTPSTPEEGGLTRLPAWSGSPLEPRNLGCLLEAGTLVCQIAEPEVVEASALIDQRDLPWVRKGQRVRLWVEQGPVHFCSGTIVDLARTDAKDLPPSLLAALRVPDAAPASANPNRAAMEELSGGRILYQARIELDAAPSAPLRVGMLGRVRIAADWQTLGSRLWRTLQQTFSSG
ncbi:Putative peptide zinc metalloprotease protein YydH [Anatilimnocola aggregata]|uniref:Peptide zinc metalloprotease protein YydH n=1 Tax=Anatilimnocola aggregata TaxID=2528021 RepID=A0A517YE16_9BACT|nr:HlyD family efflux transporter periplasmic adaptor subunit [Anatilimnocola aggregata]QDU28466.1 Putative peptide zinc metalloprotease protein YydH [Anatilimnocola aggregata]